jgi:hypothetical protein
MNLHLHPIHVSSAQRNLNLIYETATKYKDLQYNCESSWAIYELIFIQLDILISLISRNPKAHHRVQKIPPLDPATSQINLVNTFAFCILWTAPIPYPRKSLVRPPGAFMNNIESQT